jgi:RNA polymerase sigma factor (sigma-70 family)
VSAATQSDPAQLRGWLQAAARDDRAAFRSLYDASSPRLYGLALRILGRRELAEEVLQDSFVAIWHSACSYEGALSAPMTWMTTIVRNKAFDLLRRTRHDIEIDGEPFDAAVLEALRDPQATPIESLQMSSDAKALASCMSALEERHRKVIGMAFFHDLSYTDVARQLVLPVGTVKTWIRRSLVRLHDCLKGWGAA